MTSKKLIGKIHLWLGLASGLVVFILGLTGCLLAFEYELKELLYRDRYYVTEQTGKRLPIAQLQSVAQKAVGADKKLMGLNVYNDKAHTATFVAFGENPESWNYFGIVKYSTTVYINPYTAKVQYIENTKLEFFRLMLMLHYNLLMEHIGKQIIGWSTLAFIVLLISGLVLWWPKNKAAAKQRFDFKWKDSTKWKRKNYDLHNILGFYALIFSLIIALTGMVWAFRWFDNGMQWAVNGGFDTPEEKVYQSDSLARKQPGVYDKILADMYRTAPADQYYISIAEKPSEALYAYTQAIYPGYKYTGFSYDQQTGKRLSVKYYHEKPAGEKLRSMNFDIHTGAILQLPGKILAFIISFICTGLPVTGFYIWWGRNKKESRKAKPVKKSII